MSFSYNPLNHAGDHVAFSDDNGVSFTYTPTPDAEDADSSVMQINLQPSGRLGCSNNGTAHGFSIYYDVLIQ